MSTQPTTAVAVRPSALTAMATRFNVEPAKLLDTLKQTVFKNATDAQLMALVIVANENELNPFAREIYAFPDKGGGIVPVISVDGWLKRINSHEQYDGLEKEFTVGSDGKPHSCTVTIHRKDRKFPTKHTELYSECFRNTDPWRNQPSRMLGHRATIQCARIAFGFAGADPDEAERMRETTTPEVRRPIFAAKPAETELVAGSINPPALSVMPEEDQIPSAEVAPEPPRQKRAYIRRQPVQESAEASPGSVSDAAPVPEVPPVTPEPVAASDPILTPRQKFQNMVLQAGYGFEEARTALLVIYPAIQSKADLWTGFDDIQNSTASLALADREGFLAQCEAQKDA